MASRLPKGGQLIDRDKPIEFQFDGKRLTGFSGDSLASALLANDKLLLGRSFKYHRPRGLVSAGVEEPNALFGIGEGAYFEPNNRATMLPLEDGLTAISQNRFPTLGLDIGAINSRLARIFPAGFYYKTFMFPRAAWKWLYEPFIRRTAGLGRGTNPGDPDRYEHYYAHFDVVIAGGGIAGILAAEQAARAGLRVLLAEQSEYWGGRARIDIESIDGADAPKWVDEKITALEALENVTLRLRTQISASLDHGYILADERAKSGPRRRLWRIRAPHLIGATGAIERPLVFAGNDIPGVMLSSAIRDYLGLYAVSPGRRYTLLTNNDDAYLTALALFEAKQGIAAIIDTRKEADSTLTRAAEEAGIRIMRGCGVARAMGSKRLQAVEICDIDGDGNARERIDCDCLAMSGGWSPAVHLWSHSGGKLIWDEAKSHFAPNPSQPPKGHDGSAMVQMVGAASGALGAKAGLENTLEAMSALTPRGAKKAAKPGIPKMEGHGVNAIDAPIEIIPMMPKNAPYKLRAKAFVDFQHDVKASDIALAAREGFRSVEHAKRYTTLGMATDQGKLSNINGHALLAEALGAKIPEIGTTTFRPPYTPIPMGAIAGQHSGALFKPLRRTPMDAWHAAQNPKWEPVGDWRRPFTYMRAGENEAQSVAREVRNTRQNIGLLDASSLGKILVSGPDAAKFLDLIYTNMMSTLSPGACRYGLMCNENGFIHDDGVVARLDEMSFLCHTTSGGSDRVHAMMEEWLQTEWWELDVFTSNLTEHYAQIAVVGPKARRVLEALGGMDVSNDALPFMQFREGELGGFDARLFRISFSGELSFEIAVRADEGPALWDALMAAGAAHGIMPYGTEALHVMRAEKGFIMIGDETDGTVTPFDLGMNWIVSKKKADFLGKRGLERPLFHEPSRRHLIGVLSEEAKTVIPHGASAMRGGRVVGYVTSSYFSPTLDRAIAMALVEGGMDHEGETLEFHPASGGKIAARIISPVFFDQQGERQHVE